MKKNYVHNVNNEMKRSNKIPVNINPRINLRLPTNLHNVALLIANMIYY